MPGRHGSLVAYIRLYNEYGGHPPIAASDPRERGDSRPDRVVIPVVLVSLLIGLMAMSPLLSAAEPITSTPAAASAIAGSVGIAFMLIQTVGHPVMDWACDVDRVGLEADAVETAGVTG